MHISDVSTVFQVGNTIARVFGLKNVITEELIEFDDSTIEIALNLKYMIPIRSADHQRKLKKTGK